jgi:hypothetical protein
MKAAKLGRPGTWLKKRSITSFNASINLVATHCVIALQACHDLSVVESSHLIALAWIDGNPAPVVGTLHLPDSPLGKLVDKAYVEQTSLGWNLLFRGFWTISWRTAQKYDSHCQFTLDFQDNGASWAGRAQMWMFDLFELAWGLRDDSGPSHPAHDPFG